MRILGPEDFQTTAWKNGGGVTHVIAHKEDGGGTVWRLSIAEVASDGPFSVFEGLTRILTVIEGQGLDLHSPEGVLKALPGRPVRFHGELPVDSRLIGGPVRDLNVMFDATRMDGSVTPVSGPLRETVAAGEMAMLLCLDGASRVGGTPLAPGSVAMGPALALELDTGARALLVRLAPAGRGRLRPAGG